MALDKGDGKAYVPPPKKKRRPAPAPRSVPARSVERPGSSRNPVNPKSLGSLPFLRASEGINWRDVDPLLLRKLNQLGKATKQTITLTSGFRTYEEQARLYSQLAGTGTPVARPGSSNHEGGNAVDAVVGGQAIADAIDEATLNKFGLGSLAHINDPVHVELLSNSGYQAPARTGGGSFSFSAAPPSASVAPTALPSGPEFVDPSVDFDFDQFAPAPELVSQTLVPEQLRRRASMWASLASLPGAAPETQALARLAQSSVPETSARTPNPNSVKEMERRALAS
jgi:hypothetical protein